MKKIIVLLSLFLLACGNSEINRENDEKKVVEVSTDKVDTVRVEKIAKIEKFTLDIPVDLQRFREELSKKLLDIVQKEKEKVLIEDLLKNPNLNPGKQIDEYSIIIDDKLDTVEAFVNYLKFAYTDEDVTISLGEDESRSLISSVLVDILEVELKEKLDGFDKEHDFVASYLVPENDFSQVEVYFGFSTFYFED